MVEKLSNNWQIILFTAFVSIAFQAAAARWTSAAEAMPLQQFTVEKDKIEQKIITENSKIEVAYKAFTKEAIANHAEIEEAKHNGLIDILTILTDGQKVMREDIKVLLQQK